MTEHSEHSDGCTGADEMPVATGFECEPLTDGNALIAFFDDKGKRLNEQVVSADVIRAMPLVAAVTDAALQKGPAVAATIMTMLD